jgi:hypothetical protein
MRLLRHREVFTPVAYLGGETNDQDSICDRIFNSVTFLHSRWQMKKMKKMLVALNQATSISCNLSKTLKYNNHTTRRYRTYKLCTFYTFVTMVYSYNSKFWTLSIVLSFIQSTVFRRLGSISVPRWNLLRGTRTEIEVRSIYRAHTSLTTIK